MWPTYQPHPPGRLLSDLLTSQSNMSAYIYMQLPGGWSDQTGPPSGWLVPPCTQNRLRHSLDQYFKSVRFIATSDGLRALEEMATNNIVRARIQALWMTTTVFEGHHNLDLLGFKLSRYAVSSKGAQKLQDDDLEARWALYQAIVADHHALLELDVISIRLCKCFASFRNLDSIGLLHYTTAFLLDLQQHEVCVTEQVTTTSCDRLVESLDKNIKKR